MDFPENSKQQMNEESKEKSQDESSSESSLALSTHKIIPKPIISSLNGHGGDGKNEANGISPDLRVGEHLTTGR